MIIFATLARLLQSHPAVTMITVLATRGSVPREAGARMVVTPNGGFHGTIGGGNLEWQALAYAQSLLSPANDSFATRRYALGPQLGQCCGGDVTLGFEVFTRARIEDLYALSAREAAGPFTVVADLTQAEQGLRRVVMDVPAPKQPFAELDHLRLIEGFGQAKRAVYIYGAGHVGRATMLALLPLDFAIHWVDERAEMFPEHVPSAVKVIISADPASIAATAEEGAFALIMTHNHARDLDITHAALRCPNHAYVGVIGSETKRARFTSRLRALGLDDATVQNFICPIGNKDLKSKYPAVIAAGIACDLLLRDQALSTNMTVAESPAMGSVAQ